MTSHAIQVVIASAALRPSLLRLYPRRRIRSGHCPWSTSVPHATSGGGIGCRRFALAAVQRTSEEEDHTMLEASFREGRERAEEASVPIAPELSTSSSTKDDRATDDSAAGSHIDYAALLPRPPSNLFPKFYRQRNPSDSTSYHPSDVDMRDIEFDTPSAIVERYGSSPLPDDAELITKLAIKIDTLLRSSSPARTSTTSQTMRDLRALLARIQESAGEVVLRDWASERVGLGVPRRMLRSVAEDDVEEAEVAFRKVLPYLMDEYSEMRGFGRNAWSPRRAARRNYWMERRGDGAGEEREDGYVEEPQPKAPFLGKSRSERRVLHAYINHLLYLSARAGSIKRYDRIYGLLDEYGIRADSWTYLTKIVLADKERQMGEVARACGLCWSSRRPALVEDAVGEGQMLLEEGLDEVDRTLRDSRKSKGDRVVMNAALWAFAKAGRWDLIGPIYTTLMGNLSRQYLQDTFSRDDDADPFSPRARSFYTSSSPAPLSPPSNMLPDKITYQLLIRGLAYHGNLKAALLVVQDLSRDPRGYHPDVAEFIGIFQGFGRFGTLPMTELDRDDWFSTDRVSGKDPRKDKTIPIMPEAIRVDIGRVEKPVSAFRRLTDIWAEQVNAWDHPSATNSGRREVLSPTAKALAAEWTLPTLERVFTAFLALKPPRTPAPTLQSTDDFQDPVVSIPTRGPSTRALFYVLVAFSRMTGDDADVLRTVWTDLEDKFGAGNREGWIDWRTDNRLDRMRNGWERKGDAKKIRG